MAGRYQSSQGESSCPECQRGYFSSPGSAQCARCEVLRIAPDSGATTCTYCPINAISNDVRTMCLCIAGFYMKDGQW